eukprot:scaffold67554_cov15-Tisochrysis_lutea.AAC.1
MLKLIRSSNCALERASGCLKEASWVHYFVELRRQHSMGGPSQRKYKDSILIAMLLSKGPSQMQAQIPIWRHLDCMLQT